MSSMVNQFFLPDDPEKLTGLRPMGERVLVLLDIQAQAYGGLLIVPPSAQRDQCSGRLVAISPECPHEYGLEVGKRVLLDSSRGQIIHEDTRRNRSFVLYELQDLIAVFEEEE